jgi:hypothetical protein
MRNGSIAEDVIMQIGGWQTAEVFKRYSIKDQHDTDAAIRKLEKKAHKLRYKLRSLKNRA